VLVVSRAARIAAVMARNDRMYGPLVLAPRREVPAEEAAYILIGQTLPTLRAPDAWRGYYETCRMRARAYAVRVWLARWLAARSEHAGMAAAWRGSAREDLYKFRMWSRSALVARQVSR
jgi:hypothetical protein